MNYEAKIIQDGMEVASVSCGDKEVVEREIRHYAMLYAEDGPLKIERNYKI